jgi:hypothetical protein
MLRVEGRRGGSAGSHHGAWSALHGLFGELSSVTGNDMHTQEVLQGLADLVVAPVHLSAFRNALNYGLDEGPWTRASWPCLLRDVHSAGSVEEAVLRGTKREEQRVELLMLACGSLVRALFEDYRQRVKADARPRKWRAKHFATMDNSGFEACTAVVHS